MPSTSADDIASGYKAPIFLGAFPDVNLLLSIVLNQVLILLLEREFLQIFLLISRTFDKGLDLFGQVLEEVFLFFRVDLG
jgi:hypothetical protein